MTPSSKEKEECTCRCTKEDSSFFWAGAAKQSSHSVPILARWARGYDERAPLVGRGVYPRSYQQEPDIISTCL